MSSSLDRALQVAMSSKRPGKDYNRPSKKPRPSFYDIGMGKFPTAATLDIRDSGDSPTWSTNTTVSLPLMVRNYKVHESYQKMWRQGTPMFVYKENKGILRKCADLPLLNQILREGAVTEYDLHPDKEPSYYKNILLNKAKEWGFMGVLRSIMPGVRQMVVNVDCYGRSKLSCFLNDSPVRTGDVVSLGFFWTYPSKFNVRGGAVDHSKKKKKCIQVLPIINYKLEPTTRFPWNEDKDKDSPGYNQETEDNILYNIPLGIVSNCGGRKSNYGKSNQSCFVSDAMTLQKHIEILMC
jgi:hypothetical protein